MNQAHHSEKASIKSILYLCLISTAFSLYSPAQAQITPDNTLGAEASQLKQNVFINGALGDKIDGGATRGSNLFHSFSEFNIQDGQRVYFANPTGIENILTRVTGRNASNIFGTLGVNGAANLFLINPNGILFGQNARLDVQGSFVGTTANGVQFGNQGLFSATNPQAPSLLTINPSALWFNQLNQNAGIQNNSVAAAGIDSSGVSRFGLRVPDSKSLLLVGGNVSMDGGRLNALGGRVEFGGLGAPGNVNLLFNGDNLSLKFPENVTRASVLLTNKAGVYVQGFGGGDIAVNARNVEILGGSVLYAGIWQGLGKPDIVAGDITVNGTGEIKVAGSGSEIGNLVRSGSKGNAGNITIDAGDFSLQDGARLSASTYGQGNAGNVTVGAKNAVSLAGNAYILSAVEAGGVGKGGNIDINPATLSLTDGAQLLTITRAASATQPAGRGDAGNVNVKVTGAVDIAGEKNNFPSGIRSNVETGTVGNGGNITIDAGDFSLIDGGKVEASTYGKGDAGNVNIKVTGTVDIVGEKNGFASAIFSNVGTGTVGSGGNIFIDSSDFSLRDGALLSASTLGQGNAGNVTVGAKNAVSLSNGAGISTITTGKGNAGNIDINARSLSLANGVQIATSTLGKGSAGNIQINADDSVFVSSGSVIQAITFGQGNAGSITIEGNTVSFDGVGNNNDLTGAYSAVGPLAIPSPGFTGKRSGGDITITAERVSLQDGAQLLASTFGQGNAGNVIVIAKDAVDLANGDIFSTVQAGGVGKGGNIDINAATLSLTDDAKLEASTYGQGNAGNVIVIAKDAVDLAGGNIFSTVEAGGVGKGGNIDINAATLSLTDGAQLVTITRGASATQPPGRGDAGNVNVKVTGTVDIAGEKNGFPSGIRSNVGTGTVGNGGNIFIDSGDFSLRDGAELTTSTYGQGNAGNVTVGAKNAISLAGSNSSIFSIVGAGGDGKGGNIDINAGSLFLQDGAELTTSTYGQGNAGNVIVIAKDAVDLANGDIFSTVQAGGVGKGGNIDINAATLSLTDGAKLEASTYGQGNAGNVKITASNFVSLAGSNSSILSGVGAGGDGKGGNIDINAGLLSLQDGAQLQTSVREAFGNLLPGKGDAGNVNVKVSGAVTIAGVKDGLPSAIFSSMSTGTVGNGGNIFIDSGSFSLQEGAELEASIYGQGNAGNVTVGAKNAVSLAGNAYILSTVEAGGVGKGGNIDINAATLSLTDGAQLLTITRGASDTQPAGQGNAGNVNVKVTSAVDIAGEKNGFSSAIFSLVDTGTVGNGGNIFIDSGDFSLRDGAQLSASTYGQGNAGNIRVNAKDAVTVSGTNQETGFSSALFTFTDSTSTGKGGDITVNTNIFRLSDGALLDARTRNNQKGGDITVNANVFEALNGGQLTTTTSSNGRAGKITVNANDKVIISGIDPSYSDRITNFRDNVRNISANSGLFVSSTGSGITGDIEINSPKITLDNQGKLNAESASGNGGNINANSDLLLLRHGAQISTNAGTAEKGGDGGNININSKFIVAVPNENSDISANAFTGTGGNIQINSQGIFGIESRPKPTDKSDITASSELGVSGVTNINAPDNSSIQNSFTELSPNVIDTNALIANSCISRGTKRQENSFTITGSGALRNSPGNGLVSTYTTGEVRGVEPTSRTWKKGDPIIEPQGLYRLPNGQLILSRSCSI